MIRAGIPSEAIQHSGEWVFVDLGFAEKAKSCGLLIGDGEPEEVLFSELQARLLEIVAIGHNPLNLLIEAPLSVAFNEKGNPTRRKIERQDSKTRYWYVGLGCSVLVSATYVLRAIHDAKPGREIRLFEGFASFKPKDVRSSHSGDVLGLRMVVWEKASQPDQIVSAKDLVASPGDELFSAFSVAGMDFGVPAVVVLS